MKKYFNVFLPALALILVLLVANGLMGCAHQAKETGTFTFAPGPFTSGGVTYYPVQPGTTNYGTVAYTTNPPAAGVIPMVTLVTTNANWSVKLIDGPGLVSTNAPVK